MRVVQRFVQQVRVALLHLDADDLGDGGDHVDAALTQALVFREEADRPDDMVAAVYEREIICVHVSLVVVPVEHFEVAGLIGRDEVLALHKVEGVFGKPSRRFVRIVRNPSGKVVRTCEERKRRVEDGCRRTDDACRRIDDPRERTSAVHERGELEHGLLLALKLAKLARDKLETVEPFVVAPHEHDRRPGRQRLQGLVDMQEEQAVVDKLVRQLVEG